MRAIIMASSNKDDWYRDKIGKTYKFIRKDTYFCYVDVNREIKKIRVNDCQIY
ncbi:hypothetical protein [Clostridium felsineum]|uniref:Uncharacterized protein n=1 Tax=Clostridium felsineum TaxID=36839 RepID=A0A1S8LDB5_9CLOT|nr:hypothetical protein [Clostridium felsineum]URZ05911.1 hypothetical protein CLROS_012430 [Clostridium felsineum]URZ10948.1 hypothetical protein CROST_016640 [Clostridium felsineum]